MTILCRFPLAVRIGFWLFIAGFTLGVVAGLKVDTTDAPAPAPIHTEDSRGNPQYIL